MFGCLRPALQLGARAPTAATNQRRRRPRNLRVFVASRRRGPAVQPGRWMRRFTWDALSCTDSPVGVVKRGTPVIWAGKITAKTRLFACDS